MGMPWAYPKKRDGRDYEGYLHNLDVEEWKYTKLMEWHCKHGNDYAEGEIEFELHDIQNAIRFAREMRKRALECEQYQ